MPNLLLVADAFDSPAVQVRAARAHELKNCLSVIQAISHLLEKELSARGRERLLRVREAVARIDALISLDLCPDDPPDTEQSRELEVRDLVHAVVGRVEDAAERARVRFEVECGQGSVRGNPAELIEALHNLVANAIAATPSDGLVRLRTSETAAGEQLWEVEDTGCGMDEELLANVGRPFYSLREGGSGIGVAVVRETVRRQGGRLTIDSTPGVGTVAQMWIPCAAATIR